MAAARWLHPADLWVRTVQRAAPPAAAAGLAGSGGPAVPGCRRGQPAERPKADAHALVQSLEASQAPPASQAPQPASQISKEVAEAVARAL